MKDNEFDLYIEKFKDRFDRSIDSIDGETASRITQARYRALEQASARSRPRFGLWIPAGALATVCLSIMIYSLVPQKPVDNKTFIDEVDIISELDLYENLEFYEWLEQHELPS